MFVLIEGLDVVRVSENGRKAYFDDMAELYLDCSMCRNIVAENEFKELKEGFLGRSDQCKECDKKHRRKRLERIAEQKHKYLSQEFNPKHKKRKVSYYRRNELSKKKADHLTSEQRKRLGKTYVLVGQKTNDLDPTIPVYIGYGGNTFFNVTGLNVDSNLSRYTVNVFEWAEQNHARLGFSMNRFNQVMTDVASRNGMTLAEYRDHVYWCFDNPIDFISPL